MWFPWKQITKDDFTYKGKLSYWQMASASGAIGLGVGFVFGLILSLTGTPLIAVGAASLAFSATGIGLIVVVAVSLITFAVIGYLKHRQQAAFSAPSGPDSLPALSFPGSHPFLAPALISAPIQDAAPQFDVGSDDDLPPATLYVDAAAPAPRSPSNTIIPAHVLEYVAEYFRMRHTSTKFIKALPVNVVTGPSFGLFDGVDGSLMQYGVEKTDDARGLTFYLWTEEMPGLYKVVEYPDILPYPYNRQEIQKGSVRLDPDSGQLEECIDLAEDSAGSVPSSFPT